MVTIKPGSSRNQMCESERANVLGNQTNVQRTSSRSTKLHGMARVKLLALRYCYDLNRGALVNLRDFSRMF
jgi:hypothetical protein